jgi:hypothetical protein
MKRRVLIVALVLVFTATLAVAVNALRGPRQDGPLKGTDSRMNIKAPLAAEQILVWGKDLPWDPAVGDIRIESIEPVGTRGLEVVGLVVNNSVLQADGTCVAYAGAVIASSFPPPEIPTRDVEGAVLVAADGSTCSNHTSVLVGVRRPTDSSAGRIDAIRVLYVHEGTRYELVMPYSLDVCPPQPTTKFCPEGGP